MGKTRENIGKYISAGLITITAGLASLGAYASIWEYRQPKQTIENAQVLDIMPYRFSNDLHLTSKKYTIKIDKSKSVIDFQEKSWDNTIKKGDSIDLVVRKSFPLFGDELDGLKIKSHR
jgi:hypothetical protein